MKIVCPPATFIVYLHSEQILTFTQHVLMAQDNQHPANENAEGNMKLDDLLAEMGISMDDDEPTAAVVEVPVVPSDPRLSGSLADKISYFYEKCLAATQKDADRSYVEELYNPVTTTLDNANLYLNLRVLYRMQQLKTIDFYYDEDLAYDTKGFHDTIALRHMWWNTILEAEGTDEEKYVKIAEKNIIQNLYSSIFKQMYTNGDKSSYNQFQFDRNNLLSEAMDEETLPHLEDGMIAHILKRTVEGSVVVLTKDMVKYFEIHLPTDADVLALAQIESDEEFENNKGEKKTAEAHVRYLGVWQGRDMYVANVERLPFFRGVTHSAFFIHNGINNRNKYLVNPTKPLVYFNVVDNPMLTKPNLELFGLLDYKFFQTATVFFQANDLID